MRALAWLTLALAARLGAMGARPRQPEFAWAVERFQAGDFGEAGAVFKALAAGDGRARKAWLGFLFERQGYGALELEIGEPRDAEERLLLARALAAESKWKGALARLEGLDGLQALELKAEALDALDDTAAGRAYEAALEFKPARPESALSAFKAAAYAERKGEFKAAESRYKRAEKADQAYGAVNKRLAEIYFERGRAADAKARLERALRADPLDAEARDCLNLLLKAYPSLAAAAKAREAARGAAQLGEKNPRVTALAPRPGEPTLRVGLLSRVARFKFRTGAETRLEPLGLTLPAQAVYELCLRGKAWRLERVEAEGNSRVASFDGKPVWLASADLGSTLDLFDVDFGSGYFWAGKEDRAYRGGFEIDFEGFKGATLVNLIPLDAYLLSVLPSEMPSGWPAEALLAQAVAARGDTLGKLRRHGAQGFDLCSEAHCQMYRGVGEESAATSFAVTKTAGEVLSRKGKLVGGIYMNSCGGRTQDAWEAWTGEPAGAHDGAFDGPADSPWKGRFPLDPAALIAYLDDAWGGVDAWCSGPQRRGPYSEFRWIARYTAEELEAVAGRRHPVGRLLAVEPLERSAAGYVKRLRFIGSLRSSVGSSDYIRGAVKGLRSNLFYVETRRDALGAPVEFLFHGGGWGHGVGFCQSGAAGMAAAGHKHAEILPHYFPGAEITRRY